MTSIFMQLQDVHHGTRKIPSDFALKIIASTINRENARN